MLSHKTPNFHNATVFLKFVRFLSNINILLFLIMPQNKPKDTREGKIILQNRKLQL